MRVTITITFMILAAAAVPAPVSAQEGSETLMSRVPRTPDGKPKLDGIWQALAPANWDLRPHAARAAPIAALGARGAVPPGMGVVEGNEIPYQTWALEQWKENYAHRLERDPEVKCYMPGVPRATYLPHPFQILQTDDYVLIAYQYAGAVRTVYMNDPGPAPDSFWMGWSVGHWDGDTLVVEVTDQKADTWFDRAGDFHSEDLRVEERYTPMGPNHLRYEATIEDPKVFTRPWKISLPLYRRVEEDAQLMEFKCVPFAEEVMYGHLRKGARPEGPDGDAGSDTR